MIEAFANESETANIERPLIAALPALNDKDERTVKSRTSQTSHFSPTVKTKAGLFRLHQQHTQPEYSWRRTDLPNDQQSNLTCLFSSVWGRPVESETEPPPLCRISDLAAFCIDISRYSYKRGPRAISI